MGNSFKLHLYLSCDLKPFSDFFPIRKINNSCPIFEDWAASNDALSLSTSFKTYFQQLIAFFEEQREKKLLICLAKVIHRRWDV